MPRRSHRAAASQAATQALTRAYTAAMPARSHCTPLMMRPRAVAFYEQLASPCSIKRCCCEAANTPMDADGRSFFLAITTGMSCRAPAKRMPLMRAITIYALGRRDSAASLCQPSISQLRRAKMSAPPRIIITTRLLLHTLPIARQ